MRPPEECNRSSPAGTQVSGRRRTPARSDRGGRSKNQRDGGGAWAARCGGIRGSDLRRGQPEPPRNAQGARWGRNAVRGTHAPRLGPLLRPDEGGCETQWGDAPSPRAGRRSSHTTGQPNGSSSAHKLRVHTMPPGARLSSGGFVDVEHPRAQLRGGHLNEAEAIEARNARPGVDVPAIGEPLHPVHHEAPGRWAKSSCGSSRGHMVCPTLHEWTSGLKQIGAQIRVHRLIDARVRQRTLRSTGPCPHRSPPPNRESWTGNRAQYRDDPDDEED